ncbi:MAG: glycosyltransferase family 39 protein, partial [Caulobacterales bacterium]|nr:glycosyltransferase family 39 protein [Caulobacterales bacterium]
MPITREAMSQTQRSEASAPRLFDTILAGVLIAVAVVGAVGAFVGLTTSSLFVDELVTAYVVDPVSGGPDNLWARALEDVHPPLYPLLAAGATAVVGDFTVGARGLAALCAVATLAVLYLGTRGVMDRPARLFTVAAASASGAWFYYAQQARDYSLAILLAAGLAWAALSALRQMREGREADARTLAAIALLGIAGSLSHYYELLLTGAVIGYLVLAARSWAGRIRFAATGLAVLVVVAGFLAYHSPHIVVETDDLWFDSSVSFYLTNTVSFAATALGSGYGVVMGALLAIPALILIADAVRTRDVAPLRDEGLGLALAAVIGTIAIGIASSVLVAPNYSARNPVVTLPFVWIA